MQITDIRIALAKALPESGTLATASVTFDDVLIIRDFKVVAIKGDLKVCFPANRKGGKMYDVAFPLSKEFRELVCLKIITAFDTERESRK